MSGMAPLLKELHKARTAFHTSPQTPLSGSDSANFNAIAKHIKQTAQFVTLDKVLSAAA